MNQRWRQAVHTVDAQEEEAATTAQLKRGKNPKKRRLPQADGQGQSIGSNTGLY